MKNNTETEDHEIQNVNQNKSKRLPAPSERLPLIRSHTWTLNCAPTMHHITHHQETEDPIKNQPNFDERVSPVTRYTSRKHMRLISTQVTYRFTEPVAFSVIVQKFLHHVLHPHKPAGHCFIDQRRVRPAKERFFSIQRSTLMMLKYSFIWTGRTTKQRHMAKWKALEVKNTEAVFYWECRNLYLINHFKSKSIKMFVL